MPLFIASIGECMVELSDAGAGLWRSGFAGDTFNTLWSLRAVLPAAGCDFVSAFGDDPFSDRMRAFMVDAGIGTGGSPIICGGTTGVYAITLDGAERSFTYWRSNSAARRLADDPDGLRKSLEGRRLAHFSGITMAILEDGGRGMLLDSLAEARRAGTIISFDPNWRSRLWASQDAARSVLAAAAAIADIVLPSFSDEAEVFGDASPSATVERFAAQGAREVVVKDGSASTTLLVDGRPVRIPVPPADAVDTTGAGDAFNAGYLAARLQGTNPIEAVERAHRVAAVAIGAKGALAPAPDLREAFEG